MMPKKPRPRLSKPHPSNADLRLRSGSVQIPGKLVDFLYTLMRDHIPPGDVERLVCEAVDNYERSPQEPNLYSNGWLARYAEDLAKRLG
jgi:hypothetical protein